MLKPHENAMNHKDIASQINNFSRWYPRASYLDQTSDEDSMLPFLAANSINTLVTENDRLLKKIAELRKNPAKQKPERIEVSAKSTGMTAKLAELAERQLMQPAIRAAGGEAVRRLLPIAQGDTGQSRVIARFLLSLYNGDRFPFDLTDFRLLDGKLHDDCIAVLRMDHQPLREVHLFFDNGGNIFEQIAADWCMLDHYGKNWRSTKQHEEQP